MRARVGDKEAELVRGNESGLLSCWAFVAHTPL